MDEQKKKIIFAVTLVLLVLAVAYRVNHPYVQPRVTQLTYDGKSAMTDKQKDIEGKLDRKDNKTAGTGKSAYDNDLFTRFFDQPLYSGRMYKDLFSRPGQETAAETTTVPDQETPFSGQETPEAEATAKVADPMDEVREYIASLRLLGWFESGDKQAVFLARDGEVMVVGAGDTLNEKYVVENIGETGIAIKVPAINETIHLEARGYNGP